MRLRATHLAGILLLLVALSSAEAAVVREGACTFRTHSIGVLLSREGACIAARATLTRGGNEALLRDLPVASRAHFRAVWTMRPPSSHTADLHAVTGSAA